MRARRLLTGFGLLTLSACTPPSGSDDGSETTESETTSTTTESSESDTGGSTDSTDTGETCPTPLPPEAFDPQNQLAFGLTIGGLELETGSTRVFEVGLIECCYVWQPLETCSVYGVEPDDLASIDPDSGLLDLTGVPDGTWLTVRADVEDGLALVEEPVFVYDPALHPLKGFWHEVARIPCEPGPEYVPDDPIGELYFTASGSLGVTWQPFEVYVDYWGDYLADPDTGSLSLENLGGNYLPDDVDPEGSFAFEGDELVLTDMWLGSAQGSMGPPACGHRFAK